MSLRPHRRAALLVVLLLSSIFAQAQQPPVAQKDPRVAEFKQLAAQLVERRRTGADESEDSQEKTLKLLDAIVLEELNKAGPPDLAAINQHLAASLVRPGAVGESYELVRVGAAEGEISCVLAVIFSMSGPSAVRFYPASAQGYRLAARIDRWEFPDYFDEYVELVPVKASSIIFVTVNGRTDELRTGTFAAWRFAEGRFTVLWSTDILERSSYEARPDGFQLTYCSQADENKPRLCRKVMRERYVWDGMAWRRVEQQESDAPKPAPPPRVPATPPRKPPLEFPRRLVTQVTHSH
jgi:hypothetical protein